MVNIAQTQKRELEIDKMIIALVDHNWRQQFSENIKTLAAKKIKGKPVIEKGKSTTPPFIKKDKGKKRCKHYGSVCHVKKSYHYPMLADWEPY